jgi:hypothetical protein
MKFFNENLFRYKTFQITRGQLRLPWNIDQVSHEHLPFKTPEQLKV